MPRRKPASSKQHKAELQLKRAIKRGDVPAPPPQPKPPRGKRVQRSSLIGATGLKSSEPSSKRLQSAFLKVEPEFLDRSKMLAVTERLRRPLPAEASVLDASEVGLLVAREGILTCPKRPKWRFDMAKKEVEMNEQGLFHKWIDEMDGHIQAWRESRTGKPVLSRPPLDSPQTKEPNLEPEIIPPVPTSPTYYERNLEVWRQLWRVSEISQIILLLLDSRCPALHFPPSLHAYLTSLRPARPLILVLTKSDLVPASYISAWSTWLRDRYPTVRVVKVASYRERDGQEERKGQGQKKRFDPEMMQDDLYGLVEALKAAHAELMTPPERIRNDEQKMKNWKPSVKGVVDWEAALRGGRVPIDEPMDNSDQAYITVGLIGQPNVGKSSLLNALFGTHKVKASRTPGKTKHFQTLFWTSHIRFVDCPGLVMPNFVRMELQVLCGILPISQIPSIPSCIHYALRLLPMEQILHLSHPSKTNEEPEDKRTWRGERSTLQDTKISRTTEWSAMDVLVAHATSRGWVTAKAGRPDANRAGNALLRALAEGKLRWAFWPPGVPLPEGHSAAHEANGIWLGNAIEEDVEEAYSDVESNGHSISEGSVEEGSNHDSDEDPGENSAEEVVGGGRFGALALDEEAEDTEASEDDGGGGVESS